ncbi:trehalose-phosphatase [Cupriavidus sp. 2TAF22]|uniref:trehalose-phosphatase n=1 Tax=unclassified Cupriavidus TaxID=2640874 RepID=UPI003F9162E8
MPPLPLIEANTALFLDFDGTLADLAPRPDLVQVEPELVGTLRALHRHLDGALALVSGRPIAELDDFLKPLRLPAAGVHGAELRDAGGHRLREPDPGVPLLLPPLQALVSAHPGLQLERKSVAVAVHYRAVPELEGLVRNFAATLAAGVPGVELLHGKMVVEFKPAGVDKGGAIDTFMRGPPFARRTPLFAGDDITDEAGFAVVRRLGGVGVLVGQRPSAATVSVTGPAALRCWLHRSAKALEVMAAAGAASTSATTS